MSQTVKNIIVNVMVIITKALMSFSWAKSKPSPWFDVFILCLVNRSIPILLSSSATEVHQIHIHTFYFISTLLLRNLDSSCYVKLSYALLCFAEFSLCFGCLYLNLKFEFNTDDPILDLFEAGNRASFP